LGVTSPRRTLRLVENIRPDCGTGLGRPVDRPVSDMLKPYPVLGLMGIQQIEI